ncbi:MAG TPA: phosphatase [Candidatus Ornithomonoglobus intestinigallinarum]|uniref:Phosphatase n=1 Tax=Candidatus Ornithomonoglobus intestinigallinarum TaxID=2840894 RepID=A0A9D1KQ93_9FIRM|nr:phosphatase [Candidatus Ornithomonoglobus intestinigallinarum]
MTTGEKVMKILADTHTHTIASTHAYSTVAEMARAAHDAGLEAIAVTDHGMMLPDAPHSWHFHNLKNIPREICGVKILYGIEANILDPDGNIDPLEDEIYKKLDIVNASIHSPCYAAERGGDHTGAYLNIVNDPRVDIICHSGTAAYPYDYERIIKLAGENNKLIEINNHSFAVRKSSIPNCRRIAELCKEHGTGIVVTSDAHISFDLGDYGHALNMLEELDFPEELIINRSFKSLSEFFEAKGKPFFGWHM